MTNWNNWEYTNMPFHILYSAISNHMITKISRSCCWLRSLSNFNQPNLHNDSYTWCSLALSWQRLISTFTRKWPISQFVSCVKDATWLHKHAEATTNLQKRRSTKYTRRKMSLTPSLVSSQATSSNPSNDKHQGTSVLWSSIAIPAW